MFTAGDVAVTGNVTMETKAIVVNGWISNETSDYFKS